ncbi:MAG: DNA polymerase III subunit alpha [Paludibacteraceae bacterium]|nr:DNA polymerase III subunit alpha [Paludibacteraceae bacterium]
MNFTHLHVHTQYSVLDGMSSVGGLIDRCKKYGMNALAITDHGNMFGVKEFFDKCAKNNDGLTADDPSYIKPIFGVEAYCARRHLTDKDKDYKITNPENGRERIVDFSGYHLILLAKNMKGYENLCHMVSVSWVDGYYSKPRIDKYILKEHSEGLIVCSACLGGEIAQLIMANQIDEARKSIMWFKEIFGDDYYLEIQRHKTDKPRADQTTYIKQKKVNEVIMQLAQETNTKVIATNDVHFLDEENADAHELLICLSTGKDVDDPTRMCYTKQEWFKSKEQMAEIFADIPEVLENTQEIVDKVETFSLKRDPIMPKFAIPEDFGTEEEYRQRLTEQDLFDEFTRNEKGEEVMSQKDAVKKIEKLGGYDKLYRIKLEADYLKKLTFEGAKMRYGDPLPEHIAETLIFELHVMKTMGFPGYFLIVQDFIMAARNMGVSVGPGRGSAAGSVVAYCLQITDIDPLKYDLLFERFLNPDRISLPDIDVDFDDDGRAEVLRWVTQKYGAEKVAHIITFGTMATKSSIKDVGRILKMPLADVNRVTKMIPAKFGEDKKDPKTGKVPKINIRNCLELIPSLQDEDRMNDEMHTVFKFAGMLEGTVRQTGIHACGVIIGADDLKKFAPLSTAKDKDTKEELLVTQYVGSMIEDVGLIKMDFLGLKTLSIIKETLKNIKISRGEDVDIAHIPIDDPETYKLYQEGNTIATFQFESPGMRKYLRELKPTVFEDLIAMNALYRPGPMDYIPDFIDRKLGKKPIEYDIPCMEKYLKDTYGITVYQEQVMLLSRQLASFTRGESDTLRKAMGKKLKDKLDHLKPKFIKQGQENGHDPKILEKIWGDWEKFASYAFNKSHATCYSWVAYQTAYLKAHYPAEFMAGNLTRSLGNATDIEKLMAECMQMRISVLGPDVNESEATFSVNKKGEIRFGLAAIKGAGSASVEYIINERKESGPYTSVYDFFERIPSSKCNSKTLEVLIWSGAMDCFRNEIRREQFFGNNSKGNIVLDELKWYGEKIQADKMESQLSLFDGLDDAPEMVKPSLDSKPIITDLEILNKEKDLLGIYISAHPLDQYRTEILYGCSNESKDIANLTAMGKGVYTVGGIVLGGEQKMTKNNKPYGILKIEDYSGTAELRLFGQRYLDFAKFFVKDLFVYIQLSVQMKNADYKWAKTTDEMEVVVTGIKTLEEARETMHLIEDVTVTIDINKNEDSLREIGSLIQDNKGETEFRIEIIDSEFNARLMTRSRLYKVNAQSNDFIKTLEKMQMDGQIEQLSINGKAFKTSTEVVEEEFTDNDLPPVDD